MEIEPAIKEGGDRKEVQKSNRSKKTSIKKEKSEKIGEKK